MTGIVALALRRGIATAVLSLLAMDSTCAAVPQLTGALSRNTGAIAGRQRSFLLYVPRNLKPGAPLLLVIHGGNQEGADVRRATGFEFDMLADSNGFLLAYPDGIDQGWSTCRKTPIRRGRPPNIDDVGFIEAIVANQAVVHAIDRKRVFLAGHSNGGAMSYRLALEHPEEFAGIAAISSSLPSQSDMSCNPKNLPIPVLIMNGTADPVNPYAGGMGAARKAGADPVGQTLGAMGGGMGSNMDATATYRGASFPILPAGSGGVMSTEATAQYWAKVNGQNGPPNHMAVPHLKAADPTSVEVTSWTAPDQAPVLLYSIVGGGHVVPQPYFQYPSNVGRQTQDIDAPAVIWDFFSKLPSRP
jgi:polyhydroxybutyrate depolymerase